MIGYLLLTISSVLYLVHPAKSSSSVLMWQPLNDPASRKEVHFTQDNPDLIRVDGAAEHQITVKVTNILKVVPQIQFTCQVYPLDKMSTITGAEFCWEPAPAEGKLRQKMCRSMTDSIIFFLEKLSFYVTFDQHRGANITTNWDEAYKSSSRKDPSGRYWCEYQNPNGKLSSTVLEVQDLIIMTYAKMFSSEQTTPQIVERDEIRPDHLPLTLECPQAQVSTIPSDDLAQSVPKVVVWAFCTLKTVKECQRISGSSNNLDDMDNVFTSSISSANGKLTIFSLASLEFSNRVLMCRNSMQGERIYNVYAGVGSTEDDLKPLLISNKDEYRGPLMPISPTSETRAVRAGKRVSDFTLTALYKGNYERVKPTWTKNGQFVPGRSDAANRAFQLILGENKEIRHSDAGEYQLRVEKLGASGDPLIFRFTVIVTSPPVVKRGSSKFESVEYVLANSSFTTEVEFEGSAYMTLSINGYMVTHNAQTSKWSNNARGVLAGLDFTVSPIEPRRPMKYTAHNLQSGMDHVITFEAVNDIGITRLHKFLRVVPKPQLQYGRTPSSKECTATNPCRITDVHTFFCQLEEQNRIAIMNMGVQVRISWLLGYELITAASVKTQTYMSTFNLTHAEDGILSLEPVVSIWNGAVIRKLSKVDVSCVLEMFPPNGVSTLSLSRAPLYHSHQDSGLRDVLVSKLILVDDNSEQPIAKAVFSWWWLIVIAALLILFMAVLLGYLIFRRAEGDTYDVDKEERALGNDPEKEVKEKEHFHTYERTDAAMEPYDTVEMEPLNDTRHVSHSPSASSVVPPSESEGDDDFEKDYEVDKGIAKFNADGTPAAPLVGHSRANGAIVDNPMYYSTPNQRLLVPPRV